MSFINDLLPSKTTLVLTLVCVALITYLWYSLSVAQQTIGNQAIVIAQLEVGLKDSEDQFELFRESSKREVEAVAETKQVVTEAICDIKWVIKEVQDIPEKQQEQDNAEDQAVDIDGKLPASLIRILNNVDGLSDK